MKHKIVSTLLGATALAAGVTLTAPSMPAQAVVLGTLDLAGDASFGSTLSFSSVRVLNKTGVFSSLTTPINLASLTIPDLSSTSAFLALGPSFAFVPTTKTFSSYVPVGGFIFASVGWDGEYAVGTQTYKGSFSITAQQLPGGTSSFSASAEAVPEPLTLLSSGVALAMGAALKKKLSKAQS